MAPWNRLWRISQAGVNYTRQTSRRLFLTLMAICLRGLMRLFAILMRIKVKPQPDAIEYIPSTNRGHQRMIQTHVYRPANIQYPAPVLVNFCGSGFVVPGFGLDDSYCREISQRTGHIVIDVKYRLAPENPFPAALEDARTVLEWVLDRPSVYKKDRISVSGFSAGGNLATSVVSNYFTIDTFYCLIAFYPCVDAQISPYAKRAPEVGKPANGMGGLPPQVLSLFQACYLLGEGKPNDPRVSPTLAELKNFPNRCLFITAAYDVLARETESLAARLKENSRYRRVVTYRAPRVGHAFDKAVRPGTPEFQTRRDAYNAVVDILREPMQVQ